MDSRSEVPSPESQVPSQDTEAKNRERRRAAFLLVALLILLLGWVYLFLVLGPHRRTHFRASVDSVKFESYIGSPLAGKRRIRIESDGPANFRVSADPWIYVSPRLGTTPADIEIDVKAGKSSAVGSVRIARANGEVDLSIPVSIHLIRGEIGFSVDEIALESIDGGPALAAFSLRTQPGILEVPWALESPAPWLKVEPSSGRGPTDVRISAETPQNLDGVLRVFSPEAYAPPLPVHCVVKGPEVPARSVRLLPSSLQLRTMNATVGQKVGLIIEPCGSNEAWTATGSVGWLSVKPAAGAGAAEPIVEANPVGLPPGTHSGRVEVRSASGAVAACDVTLAIDFPQVRLSPERLDIEEWVGRREPRTSALSVVAESATGWTLEALAPWLKVSAKEGRGSAKVTVSIDTSALKPGTNSGAIRLTTQGAAPIECAVNVTVRRCRLSVPPTVILRRSSNSDSLEAEIEIRTVPEDLKIAWEFKGNPEGPFRVAPFRGTTPAVVKVTASKDVSPTLLRFESADAERPALCEAFPLVSGAAPSRVVLRPPVLLGDLAPLLTASKGRLVLVTGVADWCVWSHRLRGETWSDETALSVMNDRFVCGWFDRDENKDLAERLGVKAVPESVFLDGEGQIVTRFLGYLPAHAYRRRLEAIADGWASILAERRRLDALDPDRDAEEAALAKDRLILRYVEIEAWGQGRALAESVAEIGRGPDVVAAARLILGMNALLAGDIKQARRRFDEGLADLEKAPAKIAEPLFKGKARILFQNGESEAAVELCDQALKAFPESADRNWWWYSMGLAHGALGQREKAVEAADKALEGFPDPELLDRVRKLRDGSR